MVIRLWLCCRFEAYSNMIKPSVDLVTFFRNSPLVDIELDSSRVQDLPKDIEL